MTLVSHTQLQKLYFAEAIIAMSWANDDLDARERRLIRLNASLPSVSLTP